MKEDLAQRYWKLKGLVNNLIKLFDEVEDTSSREELLLILSNMRILLYEYK